MFAGNGKNYLYDTAHVPLTSHLADVGMAAEDSDANDFLQAIKHYVENPHLRLGVSAAADLRRGTKKAIKANADAYIKTVEIVHSEELEFSTAKCPCCDARFKWRWNRLAVKKNGLTPTVHSDLRKHFKICTAANGTPALTAAYKTVRSNSNTKVVQRRCEQAGRKFKPGCGRGNGDKCTGLQLYMDSFNKTKLQDIITYVPIHPSAVVLCG